MNDKEIHYPAEFTDRLETIWGEGFLSPGGPEEVREIVAGIGIQGKSVLDIGCGTGGVEIVLAGELGAGHITAIDIEPQLVERTRGLVARHGLDEKVDVRLVGPGPLDFPDNSFDIVFSKDSLIHVPDKKAMFSEILRVLKPGGIFVASDWLIGEGMADDPGWLCFCQLTHLGLTMATAQESMDAMRECGFMDVSMVDRNQWYAQITVQEVRAIEGSLRNRLLEIVDQETYLHWVEIRRSLRDATNSGALRPTHLRGYRAES
jgi:phosphoethanolamine N-methyltransferase